MPADKKLSTYAAIVFVVLALGYAAWKLSPVVRLGSLIGNGQSVTRTGVKYRSVAEKPTGWFTTGQEADIVLSAIDFDDAGGPLLFNHPGSLASDGQRLVLADRNNNRVLIWNEVPRGNEPPDLVLGQKDFNSIAAGSNMDELNWPVCVATDGTWLIVCDTQNHRVLVWQEFPTQNGEAADLVFGGFGDEGADRRGRIAWPWAAWSNGEKLIVTSTSGAQVLIWNEWPKVSQTPADLVLKLPQFGTPRSIGSDGKHLAISDHNAKPGGVDGDVQGTFFWSEWPTRENEPYDFFMAMPSGEESPADKNLAQGEILWGMNFLPDGKFLGLGSKLYVWDAFPQQARDFANARTLNLQGGDGSGSAWAGGRLYLSLANGNKIVGFDKMPANSTAKPDFAIGAPDVDTNTLETEFIISNPVPATDGESLYVLSDFDGKLYGWKKLPDESGAHPDFVYEDMGGDDIALFENRLVIAGRQSVTVWDKLPKNGEKPDEEIRGGAGNVRWQDLRGVAMDEQYFYLGDQKANAIYVWEGMPDSTKNPVATLSVENSLKMTSDGEYLAAACCQNRPGGGVAIWRVEDIKKNGSRAMPHYLASSSWRLNLPGAALAHDGSLFIADSGGNRVLVWRDVEKAISGGNPDVILGQKNLVDTTRAIGRDSMFMPNALAFDGSFLWVGEVKFSERLLRFSVR
ncbi:MAG: hypothetical protein ABIH36_02940 [bacterium]